MLAERAVQNAAQVEAAYGGNTAEEPDAQGPDSEENMNQEEYENEEQVATVTVVEDFDIDTLIHAKPPSEHPDPGSSSNQDRDQARSPEHRANKKPISSSTKTSGTSKARATSGKKIKYETKAARLAEKKKQHARKFEKAARAGGKQSRTSRKRK